MKNYEKIMGFFECLKKGELPYSELEEEIKEQITEEDFTEAIKNLLGSDIKKKKRALSPRDNYIYSLTTIKNTRGIIHHQAL